MRTSPRREDERDLWSSCTRSFFLVLFASLLAGSVPDAIAASLSADRTPAVTGAERLSFWGAASLSQLNATLIGQGIEGTDVPAAAATQGGEILWVSFRDYTDELGMRHVFYSQHFRPAGYLASLLEANYQTDGVEMAGGTVGVHYNHGMLQAVFGTQFCALNVLNEPVIGHVADAYAAATEAATRWPGFVPRDPAQWAPTSADAQQAASKLLLVSSGDGASFSFMWQIHVADRDGNSYIALLDADTGVLASLGRANANSSQSCSPKTQNTRSAVGKPQNEDAGLPDRSIWATDESNHDDFDCEGGRPSGGGIPAIEIYFGTYESGYVCDWPDAQYAMVPLQEDEEETPLYENRTWGYYSYPGRAAGDALWFTYQTMYTLYNNLGWYSYDDNGAVARVVVEDYSGDHDEGFFMSLGDDATYAPTPGVRFAHASVCKYSFSSCLDVVAHEWGHGVVWSTAGFSNVDGTVGAQLNEGFADVIGHAVERYRQSAGSGVEKADWMFGEDNFIDEDDSEATMRQVDSFDEEKPARFHRLDRSGEEYEDTNDRHFRGNMLGVAFRLLAVGQKNPICDWEGRDENIDCTITVTGQGLDKATRILFRTLTQYAYDSMGWGDLADVAKAAAFDLYSVCPAKNGGAEQIAANKALGAIGYPGSGGYYQCP